MLNKKVTIIYVLTMRQSEHIHDMDRFTKFVPSVNNLFKGHPSPGSLCSVCLTPTDITGRRSHIQCQSKVLCRFTSYDLCENCLFECSDCHRQFCKACMFLCMRCNTLVCKTWSGFNQNYLKTGQYDRGFCFDCIKTARRYHKTQFCPRCKLLCAYQVDCFQCKKAVCLQCTFVCSHCEKQFCKGHIEICYLCDKFHCEKGCVSLDRNGSIYKSRAFT